MAICFADVAIKKKKVNSLLDEVDLNFQLFNLDFDKHNEHIYINVTKPGNMSILYEVFFFFFLEFQFMVSAPDDNSLSSNQYFNQFLK